MNPLIFFSSFSPYFFRLDNSFWAILDRFLTRGWKFLSIRYYTQYRHRKKFVLYLSSDPTQYARSNAIHIAILKYKYVFNIAIHFASTLCKSIGILHFFNVLNCNRKLLFWSFFTFSRSERLLDAFLIGRFWAKEPQHKLGTNLRRIQHFSINFFMF